MNGRGENEKREMLQLVRVDCFQTFDILKSFVAGDKSKLVDYCGRCNNCIRHFYFLASLYFNTLNYYFLAKT